MVAFDNLLLKKMMMMMMMTYRVNRGQRYTLDPNLKMW